jgi:hypothetical protein
VIKPIAKDDVRPTVVTSGVPRGDSIIETVSGPIVAAVFSCKKA